MTYNNPAYAGKCVVGLAITATTAATANGPAIDTRGYSWATLIVGFGDVSASAAGTITIKAVRDDASNFPSATDMSGWTTGALTVANALDNTTRIIHGPINDVNMERYMRISATNSGNETGVPMSVSVILSNGPTQTLSPTEYTAVVTATGT